MMNHQDLLYPIMHFLCCETPQAWVDFAAQHIDILLIDHANCELKAAQNAIMLLRKYALTPTQAEHLLTIIAPYEAYVYRGSRRPNLQQKNRLFHGITAAKNQSDFEAILIDKMLRLIKEELHHFDQVLGYMEERQLPYQHVAAGRYAKGLLKGVRTFEPAALIDKLIVGAVIEARSCERFARLIPYLDVELGNFYQSLLQSEARHFQDYLVLAKQLAKGSIDERVQTFVTEEATLITEQDPYFCFHSGVPVGQCAPSVNLGGLQSAHDHLQRP